MFRVCFLSFRDLFYFLLHRPEWVLFSGCEGWVVGFVCASLSVRPWFVSGIVREHLVGDATGRFDALSTGRGTRGVRGDFNGLGGDCVFTPTVRG